VSLGGQGLEKFQHGNRRYDEIPLRTGTGHIMGARVNTGAGTGLLNHLQKKTPPRASATSSGGGTNKAALASVDLT